MGMIKRSSATSLVGWLVLAAALLSAITVTAYAMTRGDGPKPPKRSLASAVHHALTAKPVTGLSAEFRVDQHLLSGTSTSLSSNPLLAGATGRVWIGGGHARLVLSSQLGTTSIAFDGHRVTLYNRKQHVAFVLPVKHHERHGDATDHHVPSVSQISQALTRAAQFALISGAIPSNVAGQEAYTVHVSPRQNGGLFGEFDLAWDAAHGVPLRFAIFPRGSSTAAISISVTHIRFGKVAASDLSASVPAGTKVVRVHMPNRHDRSAQHRPNMTTAVGQAVASRAAGFTVAAPRTLAGLPQRQVRAIGVGSHRAVLVTYGRGLGTVFVLEQRKTGKDTPLSALPTVTVNGIRAHELDTTLGSVIQWSRGGITYTIAGSQSAERIMSGAQSLA
jgi:outer membrane lipoprotein-sorting protein